MAPDCLRWWSGPQFAKLLAKPHFDAGQEDAALAHLKEHLSWRVKRGRDTCAGCGQTRGEDTPMFVHVQRLPCSEVLQRRLPKDGFKNSRVWRESDDGACIVQFLCECEIQMKSSSSK